jgi:hypothetical protein
MLLSGKPLSGFLMRTVISVIDLQSDLERERAKCGRAPIAGVPADREEGTLALPEPGLALYDRTGESENLPLR